jgi:hypothetical protein
LALRPELPASGRLLDVVDGGLVGEVDRLGDRAADERLGGGHHADVALDGDEPLAGLAALVGAVEDGQVFGFRCGAPSTVPRPQMTSLASSICCLVKPRWRSRLKPGACQSLSAMPALHQLGARAPSR